MILAEKMTELARSARASARQLARMTSDAKNACLLAMAESLEQAETELLTANAKDLEVGRGLGLNGAMMERLSLNPGRIQAMAKGLREVAALPDPVGQILEERVRPNGLRLRKIAVPLGVVVIIYESRPNVTADAAGLCFKTGNAVILRGGKEALNSNQCIARTLVEAGRRVFPDFPIDAIQVVPTPDREAIPILLSLTKYIDLCMPRGGEGLIRAVTECSKVPVIKHFKGVCHVYVDRDADPVMADSIVWNSKCQRPSVCNAAETLLVDRSIAPEFLARVGPHLLEAGVSFRADPDSQSILLPLVTDPARLVSATETDYETEYNDSILNVRVVDGVDQAMDHIGRYGSAHTDVIVTANEGTAQRFMQEVDSAAVYWNASTRFTDGAEYGMGAEIGISTDKVGARGPMGLPELCTYKWIGYGTGQIRE
jgi:glutamate-5-semialdehyde dehydrogenase